MAMGPAPTGLLYFLAVKLAGYSLFAATVINRRIDSGILPTKTEAIHPPPNALISGLIRTTIGLLVGTVVGLTYWKLMKFPQMENHDGAADLLFFALLVPIRIGEWSLLLRVFYRSWLLSDKERRKIVWMGIVVSFALDALGIVTTMVMPGGVWVC